MTTRRVLKTSLLPTIRETSRTEQYLKVQNEALELFKKKNNDYGDAFATYGTVGIIVRLGDKITITRTSDSSNTVTFKVTGDAAGAAGATYNIPISYLEGDW